MTDSDLTKEVCTSSICFMSVWHKLQNKISVSLDKNDMNILTHSYMI